MAKNDELPPNVTDPALIRTPRGARAAYAGTIAALRDAFGATSAGGDIRSFVAVTGLLSDELESTFLNFGGSGAPDYVDVRVLPEFSPVAAASSASAVYSALQRVRGQSGQAIGLLTDYLPGEPALRGNVYAAQGFAEVFLAELFCSGIPLSTLDYDGGYTLRSGSLTEEVFAHTVTLFDSALALAGEVNDAQVMHLARVGKARALLALGEYAAAAAAVGPVPTAYAYTLTFTAAATARAQNFALVTNNQWNLIVADGQGGTGLNYRSSADPRTRVTQRGGANAGELPRWHPNKYLFNGSSPIVLANGIEARLIEAEAALQAGNAETWLATLNALRTTCVDAATCPTPAPAGSGGIAGLPPLADPGTFDAQVNLTFRERAFWLFLTGHRQGDLRRLVRPVARGGYGRLQEQVYPTGPYNHGFIVYPSFGDDVTAPIPAAERAANPLFTGCASRSA